MPAVDPTLAITKDGSTEGTRKHVHAPQLNGCREPRPANGEQSVRFVRQYVNPAVYVESSVRPMAPCRRAPISFNYPIDDEVAVHQSKVVKVKKCVCFTNPRHCPCHPSTVRSLSHRADGHDEDDVGITDRTEASAVVSDGEVENCREVETAASSRRSRSKILVEYAEELKLSLDSSSILSARLDDDGDGDRIRDEAYRNWCARKDQEKKLQERRQSLHKLVKEKEKEIQLQQERENFKRWLARKKKEEEKKRADAERHRELERVKQEEKAQRIAENEIHFKLWLKKKEQLKLEKKLEHQMKLMKEEEDRRSRLEQSIEAYQLWLIKSKNKPKPIPLNQGIQSLKSSASVTYVNPTPWVPNIDINQKPSLQ